ncbi:MAG: 2-hydroxyacid dehydrogenase [Desulfuromonadales bacterium]
MKYCVLQHGRLTPEGEARLAAEFDVCPLWQQDEPEAFLSRHGERFVGMVTTGVAGADRAMIESLPGLRVIASRGVGYEKIDLEAARRQKVAVSNTPGVLTDCVADLAIGALIAVVRRLCSANAFVRRNAWQKDRFPLTTRVHHKRLGIVGMGRIGSAIAQRAAGFDMEIRYYSRSVKPDLPYGFVPCLAELAAWADFLVVSAPGGPETRHLVSRETLDALGANGYLVNVARGSVVDEDALVEALTKERIAGAALDVYAHEPRVPDGLRCLDNVILLPHIASNTQETFRDMEDLVINNLHHFFTNGKLLTPIC